jgi:hypothetical protein
MQAATLDEWAIRAKSPPACSRAPARICPLRGLAHCKLLCLHQPQADGRSQGFSVDIEHGVFDPQVLDDGVELRQPPGRSLRSPYDSQLRRAL